jgi:hypothetical protein
LNQPDKKGIVERQFYIAARDEGGDVGIRIGG